MTFYKDCKITDAAVSQWRKNKNKPAMTTITRIAEYLNVSPEYLLIGEETKKEPTSISESELKYSDIDLLEAFKRADPDIQELIRRTLKLK